MRYKMPEKHQRPVLVGNITLVFGFLAGVNKKTLKNTQDIT